MIRFACPGCQRPLRRNDSAAGQEYVCVHCVHRGVIPSASPVEEDATPTAQGPSLEGTAAVVSLLVIIAVAAALIAAGIFGGGG